MGSGKDSRRDPRAKVLSMTVRYKSATVAEFKENHSYDVSRGGIFIKTSSPFPPGTLLKFEVRIADEQKVIMGVGRVTWKRETEFGPEKPAGMGVKFIKLDEESAQLIEDLVDERQDNEASFERGARESGLRVSVPPPTEGRSGAARTQPTRSDPDKSVIAHTAELLRSAMDATGTRVTSEPPQPEPPQPEPKDEQTQSEKEPQSDAASSAEPPPASASARVTPASKPSEPATVAPDEAADSAAARGTDASTSAATMGSARAQPVATAPGTNPLLWILVLAIIAGIAFYLVSRSKPKPIAEPAPVETVVEPSEVAADEVTEAETTELPSTADAGGAAAETTAAAPTASGPDAVEQSGGAGGGRAEAEPAQTPPPPAAPPVRRSRPRVPKPEPTPTLSVPPPVSTVVPPAPKPTPPSVPVPSTPRQPQAPALDPSAG